MDVAEEPEQRDWETPSYLADRKPGLLDNHPSFDRGSLEDYHSQPKKRGLLDEHPVYGLDSGPPQIPGILDNHPTLGIGRDEPSDMVKPGLLDDHPQYGLDGKRQGLLDHHPKLGVGREVDKKPGLLDSHPEFGLPPKSGLLDPPKRGLLDDHPTYGLKEEGREWSEGPPQRSLLGDAPRGLSEWETTKPEPTVVDYDHAPFTSDTGFRPGAYDQDEWYKHRRPPQAATDFERDQIPPEQIAAFKAFEDEWMQGKRQGNVVNDFYNQSYCPKDDYEEEDHHEAVYPPRPPRQRPPPPRFPEDDPYANERPAFTGSSNIWEPEAVEERPPHRRFSREDDYTHPTMPVRPGGFRDHWPEQKEHEDNFHATDEFFGHPHRQAHPPPLLDTPRQPPHRSEPPHRRDEPHHRSGEPLRRPNEPPPRRRDEPPRPTPKGALGNLALNYDEDDNEEEEEGEIRSHPKQHHSSVNESVFPDTESSSQSPAPGGLLPTPTATSTVPPLLPTPTSMPQRPPLFPIMGSGGQYAVPKPVPPHAGIQGVRSSVPLLPTPNAPLTSAGIQTVEMQDVSNNIKTPSHKKERRPTDPTDLEPGELNDTDSSSTDSDRGRSHRKHRKHHSRHKSPRKHKDKDKERNEDKDKPKDKWKTGGFAETQVSRKDVVHSSDIRKGQKRAAEETMADSKKQKTGDDEDDMTPEERTVCPES